MKMTSIIVPALLVAAVLSTSVVKPVEYVRISPAGVARLGHQGYHGLSLPTTASGLPDYRALGLPAGTACADEQRAIYPKHARIVTTELAGPMCSISWAP